MQPLYAPLDNKDRNVDNTVDDIHQLFTSPPIPAPPSQKGNICSDALG